jgi:hypothetical protein
MRNLLMFVFCAVWTLPTWADSLIFSDDFSVQRPEWMLAVDGGYVGQPTLQGPLTQSMIDEALRTDSRITSAIGYTLRVFPFGVLRWLDMNVE